MRLLHRSSESCFVFRHSRRNIQSLSQPRGRLKRMPENHREGLPGFTLFDLAFDELLHLVASEPRHRAKSDTRIQRFLADRCAPRQVDNALYDSSHVMTGIEVVAHRGSEERVP